METNPIAIMYLSSPSPPSTPPISPPSPPPVSPKELQCCAALVTLSSMLDRCPPSLSYSTLQTGSSPTPISLPIASDSFKLTLPRHTDLSALIPSPTSSSWKPHPLPHPPTLSPTRQSAPQRAPLFSLFDTHSDFQWRSLPPPLPPRTTPSSSPNTAYLLPPRTRIAPPSPPSPPLSLSPPSSPFSPCLSPYSPPLPPSPPYWPESEEKKRKREETRDPWYSEEVPLRRTFRESRQRREEDRAETMRRERDMIRRERVEEEVMAGETEEEEEEIEPDFTRSGAQVLVCRRTNACPLHRTRKKRCPANCEFRKTAYTSNYAKRCVNTKARVGRCAMLDAYLCKYNQSKN